MVSDNSEEKNEDAPFDVQYQNAIFQFLFLLINVYSAEMPYDKAVLKACDWLISLATDIKVKSIKITQENLDTLQQFKQA